MEPLLGPVNPYITYTINGLEVVIDYLRGTISIDGQAHLPCNKVNHIIVGGESGDHARPMHPDWVRLIRDGCMDTGTPFLFKQWGEWVSAGARAFGTVAGEVRHIRSDGTFWNEDDAALQDECADVLTVVRVGKKAAGRDLGGKMHDGYPEAKP